MSRAEFRTFVERNVDYVYVLPYDIAPCACRDVNCHGWRLVQSDLARRLLVPTSRRNVEKVLREGGWCA